MMSSAKSDNFTSSLPICMSFISFTSLVAGTRTYNIMLNRSDDNGHLPVSWIFASGGQNTGASASASVLPMNIQG